jgi:hypothetical protein
MSSLIRRSPSRGTAGLLIGLRLGLGITLLLAGAMKFGAPFGFLDAVYGYDLLGPRGGLLVAMTLPLAEVIVGICLLGDLGLGGALLVSVGMSAVFVVAQVTAIARGLTIECGCLGGSSKSVVGFATLARSMLLMGASVAGLMAYRQCARSERLCQLQEAKAGEPPLTPSPQAA